MNSSPINASPINTAALAGPMYLFPDGFQQTPEIETVSFIVYREAIVEDVDQTPTINSAQIILKFPQSIDDVVLETEIETVDVILTGKLGAINLIADPEIESVSIVLTQKVVADDVVMFPENGTVSINYTRQLQPQNIELTPSLPFVFTGSLMALRLAEGSTRTPDAGISLDFPYGYVKGSSWYTKTTYRFVLKFHMLTDLEYHWLDGFLHVNRYNELDYAWPFDNRTYKCLLIEDLDATLVRSSTALGRLWNVTVNLIGYEV